jgi:hypothetical protein
VARRLLSNTTNVTTQWLTDGYFDINRLETTENALARDSKPHLIDALSPGGLIRQDYSDGVDLERRVQLFIRCPNFCNPMRRSSADGMLTAGNLSRQCHGRQASITARLLV